MKRAAFVAAIASFAAACTAIAGLEPLELIDPADAQAAETGSSDASSEADSSTSDATTTSDADADAKVSTGCRFVDAELCDDFDHGDPFSARWDFLLDAPGPGSMATSNELSLSSPTSVRAESLSNDAGVSVNVALEKRFPSFKGEYFLAFDVLFRVAPNSGTFFFRSDLTPTYGNNNDSISPAFGAFGADGGGVSVTAFNLKPFTGTVGVPLATVPVNTWLHLEATVRRDADAASTELTFRAGAGAPVTRHVPTEAPSAMPTTFLGLNSGAVIVEVFYDNVVMDTR